MKAQTWNDVDGGSNNPINALGTYDNKLIVSGGDTFGSKAINVVASWDDVEWDALGTGPTTFGGPFAYAVYNNELIAAGLFDGMAGMANTYCIARWDGIEWKTLGVSSANSNIGVLESLAVYKGELYVGGSFTKIGGVNVSRIAKWNGTTWSDVGGGVSGSVTQVLAMAVYNDELYVAGEFGLAGGKSTPRIAKWNGTEWNSVGGGMNGGVGSLVVDTIRNVLYAGGGFTSAGGKYCYGIAQWDGIAWSNVGSPITEGVTTMSMYHHELYVGSGSTNGLDTDTIVARWDGAEWFWVKGPNNTIYELCVYNDTLYVGGEFKFVNGDLVNYIARYYSPPPPCDTVKAAFTYVIDGSGNVEFTNTSENATNYFWNFGDGSISTGTNPSHTYADGDYTARLVSTNSCTRDTLEINFTVLGNIENEKNDYAFKVYPNPTSGQLEVKSDYVIELLEIIDVNGKVVSDYRLQITNYKIDINHLSKGIYYIKATHANGKVSQQKLIKN